MAYIAPNGNIILCHNIPLDTTYQHTLRFSSATNQHNYFTASSRVKRTFTNQYYTRLNRGVIRVNELADNLYDCNYMCYQNTSFGNKWFYAFVKSVEYVNNAVTEIQFEIDVIQTWYFDYNLLPCFVERMHSPTDAIGDNIVPESVEKGEYVFNSQGRIDGTDRHAIIVAYVDTQSSVEGHIYGRIYGGLTLKAFASQDAASVNYFIDHFISRPDAVVSLYMCPEFLITDGPLQPGGGGPDTPIEDLGEELDSTNTLNAPVVKNDIPAIMTTDTLDGYTPHNKKLYTYPYNYLMLFEPSGKSLNLRYEFFDNLKPTIEIGGSVTLPVSIIARPKNYKNRADSIKSETLTSANYPLCSWNVDAYNAWVAQSAVPIGLDFAGMATIGAMGLMNPIMGAISMPSVIQSVTGVMKESYQASIAADQIRGNQQSGNVDFSMGNMGIWFARLSVNAQFAKMIDDYFDIFGYAQKKIMQPVRKARTIWTYIKTIGCVIDGSVPSDDANKICKLHDAGITYWDVESNPSVVVGNYLLGASNVPVGS